MAPTPLDVAIVAPAALLGFLGLWLGLMRSSVAWPMRWLLPLLGAYVAGRLAEVSLLIVWGFADLRYLFGPAVTYPAFIVAFLTTLFPLLMFMSNLSARVAVWTAHRRIGPGERIFGGLLGIACGLILVAVAIDLTPIRRAAANEPAWLRESALLPYFRSLSETVERTLSCTPTSSPRAGIT